MKTTFPHYFFKRANCFADHEHVSGDQTLENDATSMGSLSDISEGPPPSYDNEWDKESLEDIGQCDLQMKYLALMS